MHPRDLLSTFCACAGPSVASVNFVCPRYFLSIFNASAGPFIRFPYGSRTFRQVSSTFRTSVGPFVNFRQLSVHPQYLPSPSVKFLCTCRIVPKHSARLQNLPSTSVNFLCICRTYRKLASTFREAGIHPVNFLSSRLTFCQLSLNPRDLSTSFKFLLLHGSSSSSTEFPIPNS